MQTVFIAGPMLGIAFLNFPAFDASAKLGRSLDWTVISPAETYRKAGWDETQYPNGDPTLTPDALRAVTLSDMSALCSLKAEELDAVALLPGWDSSPLSLSIVTTAKRLGLQVLDANTFNPITEANEFRAVVQQMLPAIIVPTPAPTPVVDPIPVDPSPTPTPTPEPVVNS